MSLCGPHPPSVTEGSARVPGTPSCRQLLEVWSPNTPGQVAGPGRQRSARQRRCPALPLLTRTPAPQALRSVLQAWRHGARPRHRPGGAHGPPGGAPGPAQAGCAAAALRALPAPAARLSSAMPARLASPAHPNTAQAWRQETRKSHSLTLSGWAGAGEGPRVKQVRQGRRGPRERPHHHAGCVRGLLALEGLGRPSSNSSKAPLHGPQTDRARPQGS